MAEDSMANPLLTSGSPNKKWFARRCCYGILGILLFLVLLGAVGVFVALMMIVGGQPPRVHTHCGMVEGKYDMLDDMFTFKGIPYAVPPVRERRWSLPEPLSNGSCWTGTLRAYSPADICAQLLPTGEFLGSEDCLYLDIITPSTDPLEGLPVYVFIHGGGLVHGDAQTKGFRPNKDLAKDMKGVFVSIQYRLGAFGYLTLDALGNHSNFGLWDQLAALQWVQDNIHAFGGDKTEVTVMGAGAGATSIYAMLASPKANGLFNAAWLMSPSPMLSHTRQQAIEANDFFLNKTGCVHQNCSSGCIRRCLIGQRAENVTGWTFPKWHDTIWLDLPTKDVFEWPLLVVDGDLLPQAPMDAFKGNITGLPNVPILIGSTAQEVDIGPAPPDLLQWSDIEYRLYVINHMNTFGGNISAEILALYPFTTDAEYSFTTLTSDIRVTCGTQELANVMASVGRKVYHYVVTSFPSKPIDSGHTSWEATYAFHGWDTLAFFAQFDDYLSGRPSDEDKDFSKNLNKNVKSFAESGMMSEAGWVPVPNSTALLGSSIEIVDSYQPTRCGYLMQQGFFQYSKIN